MRQLQFFSTAELAAMRDRTASRNHSPGHDEFRREHERHRAWGLARRHAERLRRVRDASRDSPAANTHDNRRDNRPPPRMSKQTSLRPAARLQPAAPPAPSRTSPTNPDRSRCRRMQTDQAGSAKNRQPPPAQAEPATVGDHPEPAQQPVSAAQRCQPAASRHPRHRPNPTDMPAPIKHGPHPLPPSPQQNGHPFGNPKNRMSRIRPEISRSSPRTRAPPTPRSATSRLGTRPDGCANPRHHRRVDQPLT